MRIEMKIGAVLASINILLAHILPLSQFVSGLLISLAFYFITDFTLTTHT